MKTDETEEKKAIKFIEFLMASAPHNHLTTTATRSTDWRNPSMGCLLSVSLSYGAYFSFIFCLWTKSIVGSKNLIMKMKFGHNLSDLT